jgi:hypothetical protein
LISGHFFPANCPTQDDPEHGESLPDEPEELPPSSDPGEPDEPDGGGDGCASPMVFEQYGNAAQQQNRKTTQSAG